jgi:segregation and condensation protein B
MSQDTNMAADIVEDETTEETVAGSDGTVDAAQREAIHVDISHVAEPENTQKDDSLDLSKIATHVEALLFSSQHPLTPGRLAEVLGHASTKPVRQAVAELNQQYESTGRSFRIEQVAGGYQMLTLPDFGDIVGKLLTKEADTKLGKSAMETLAIIAYKQPILRVDIESIRGVACGETIRGLMEKHLVKIAGRAELPGRPILYGTTKRFLEVFGLNDLKDLPNPESKELPPAKTD